MKFKIMLSVDSQYYFVLTARNNKVIATSETYKTRGACRRGIASVIKNAPLAKITWKLK